MSNLLETKNVRIRFRCKGRVRALWDGDDNPYIEAVCGVSLNIEPGQTFALVGESGAGKTTLARAMIGLVTPYEGSILYKGQELCGLKDAAFKPLRREIAMMFQDPLGCLSPRRTVRALVTEPFLIHGIKDVDLNREAERLLDLVGLPPQFAAYYPYQLSGGQARRVGVARALSLSPQLIIADEPTAGLDVSVQGEVLNLMARLQTELGISFLIITHNLAVVRHTSDLMAIMYLGRFVESGPTDEIFANPKHPYTQALLSATPEPDPDAPHHRVELQGEIPSLINRPTGCEFHTRCPQVEARCRSQFPTRQHVGPEHEMYCFKPN